MPWHTQCCAFENPQSFLFSLREVFSQAKSGMIKSTTPPAVKNGYVSPVKRGLVVYIMGALRGKESVSTKGRRMESFIKECKRAAFLIVNYTT